MSAFDLNTVDTAIEALTNHDATSDTEPISNDDAFSDFGAFSDDELIPSDLFIDIAETDSDQANADISTAAEPTLAKQLQTPDLSRSGFTHPVTQASHVQMTAVIPAPFTTFTYFSTLPTEIRAMIWKLVQEARLVEVRFHKRGTNREHKFFATYPILLRVCRDSRDAALKEYKIAFHSSWARNRVYFNFEIDILYLSRHSSRRQRLDFVNIIPKADRERVQRIAAPADLPGHGFCKFPQVKELICLGFMEDSRCTAHVQTYLCPWRGVGLHEFRELIAANPENGKLDEIFTKGKKILQRRLFNEVARGNATWINLKVHDSALCEHGMKSKYI